MLPLSKVARSKCHIGRALNKVVARLTAQVAVAKTENDATHCPDTQFYFALPIIRYITVTIVESQCNIVRINLLLEGIAH